MKCVALRTKTKTSAALSICFMFYEEQVLPPNIKLHSSLLKESFGRMTNIPGESKGLDSTGLCLTKQFDISRVNARLPVGLRVILEEGEECLGVGELRSREVLAFKALISFKRFK